jgi:hypothetical protein
MLSHCEQSDRLMAIVLINNTRPYHFELTVASLPAPARRLYHEQHCNQRNDTMTITVPTRIKNILDHLTEAEINAGIDEALAEAVRKGLITPTGKTQWSERRQCMIPVYKSLIYQPLLSEVEPLGHA